MSFIEFKEVDLTFQTKVQRIPIFKGLNLEIEKGEFITIAGPSGKGKSTLLNLVSGFVKPTGGEIWVDGKNLSKMNDTQVCDYRNKRIGYIFQTFNLIQQFNVRDNVAVPLLLSGMKKKQAYEKVEELLDKVGMTNRILEYPRTLSGGEQQRVAFARAIANNPDIILADEPTGNLDTKNGELIVTLLMEANKENGTTVLCVSHDERIIEKGQRTILIEEITCVE
ncbi:MAG TPA: ABC transporter ATP-binding protein [Clostridia bacterium]|jgi:ABC-type lipoprotein export system ATPase subunit|nr:ABC transporter ATP-binding protein [Clostridia bacterium]